jgi:uncharacterized membrane protein HdeD (DUF308 family)
MTGPYRERAGDEPSRARSPLNLRLLLAALGFVTCCVLAGFAFAADAELLGAIAVAFAVVAVVDIVVVLRRKRQRGRGDYSLFE